MSGRRSESWWLTTPPAISEVIQLANFARRAGLNGKLARWARGFRRQARQAFENLRRCLAAGGASFDDVVKLTFSVLDAADPPAGRAARDAVIDTDRPPVSTAVQVAALFARGYLLEVEAWALAGG